MDLQLEGRSILVTGGSDGLGRAVAARAIAEGANVTIAVRGRARLDEAKIQLDPTGQSISVSCDVTTEGALEKVVQSGSTVGEGWTVWRRDLTRRTFDRRPTSNGEVTTSSR